MQSSEQDIARSPIKEIKAYHVFIPVAFGLLVVGWMFYREFDANIFSKVEFTLTTFCFIGLSVLFMLGRDFGLIWRFRLMTEKSLTWKQAFNVNMLCEFTSAVTPSAVGGSSLIVLFLNKEGINAGRGSAIMMSTLFLDELFFVLACPVVFIFVPFNRLFSSETTLATGIFILFAVVYSLIFLWTFLLYVALFKRPDLIQKGLLKLFSLRYLKKWRDKVQLFTENLVTSSHQISGKSPRFWAKAISATVISWSSRYLVVNALFLAFLPVGDHLVIFARQLILWVVMVVSPTPGGSGLSEYMFKEYYSDFLPTAGVALAIVFIWRMVSYYMYLVVGACIVPRWIKNLRKGSAA